jgi:hypothetical protein
MTTRLDPDSIHTQHSFSQFARTDVGAASDTTYSASDFCHGVTSRDTSSADRTDTLPSAQSIVAELKGRNPATANDSAVPCLVCNTGSATLTLAAGTGVTLVGSPSVAANTTALFLLLLAETSAGNEAVRVLRIAAGADPQADPPAASVAVADIIAGTAYNPSTTSNTWSTGDAIVFETGTTYELDGDDPVDAQGNHSGPADNTGGGSDLQVSMTRAAGFFQQDGDILRVSMNWRDYSDGRLVVTFSTVNYHDSSYDRTAHTFGAFRINTNATPNNELGWLGYRNDDTPLTQDTTNLVQAARDLLATSKTTDAEPLVLELERLNNTQIRARLLDYTLAPISGQADLTCNQSTDTFSASNINGSNGMTNNDGIFVGDITHVTFQEISNSAIDLKVDLVT